MTRGALNCLRLIEWYAERFSQVFPRQSTIARRLNKSRQQTERYIRELKQLGYVKVIRRGPHSAVQRLPQGAVSKTLAKTNEGSYVLLPETENKPRCKTKACVRPPGKDGLCSYCRKIQRDPTAFRMYAPYTEGTGIIHQDRKEKNKAYQAEFEGAKPERSGTIPSR